MPLLLRRSGPCIAETLAPTLLRSTGSRRRVLRRSTIVPIRPASPVSAASQHQSQHPAAVDGPQSSTASRVLHSNTGNADELRVAAPGPTSSASQHRATDERRVAAPSHRRGCIAAPSHRRAPRRSTESPTRLHGSTGSPRRSPRRSAGITVERCIAAPAAADERCIATPATRVTKNEAALQHRQPPTSRISTLACGTWESRAWSLGSRPWWGELGK